MYFYQQVSGCPFFLPLRHEFSFNGVLEKAFFHIVRETLFDSVQLSLGFVVSIDIGLQFFYSGYDAVLLSYRRQRDDKILNSFYSKFRLSYFCRYILYLRLNKW